MKKQAVATAVCALVLGSMVVPAAGAAKPAPAKRSNALDLARLRPSAVPGEVIVQFKRNTSRTARVRAVAAAGARVVDTPAAGLALVKAAPGTSAAELQADLAADDSVAFAEPNLLRYLSATPPNDPRFSEQWGLNNTGQSHPISGTTATRQGTAGADVKALSAWDTQQGNGAVVAIMDSGVDVTHPDLVSSLWVNPGEVPGNGIDDDGNGLVDDVHGWDFTKPAGGPLLEPGSFTGYEHGTHVAGTVAAAANNAEGGSGVCPACKLMVLKVFKPFDTDGDGIRDTMVGDLASILKGFDYAIRMGANVVNGSFGQSVVSSKAERARIKKAIANGITMVFAAGNENGDNDLLVLQDFDGDGEPDSMSPSYPASYDLPGIIAVAASNDADQNGFASGCFLQLGTRQWPCSFTNWGRESVDVSAPGVDIVSTVPGGAYASFDGTSMAAPHVAGVAALVKAQNPLYSPAQVRNAIMSSADKPASLGQLFAFPQAPQSGRFTMTGGRVNAAAALTASPANSFPRTDGNISGAKGLRRAVTGRVSWPDDVNDVFKKKLTKGVRYKVTLRSPVDVDLQIYRPRTTEIWQIFASCLRPRGACQTLYYDPTDSGNVTVKFRAPQTGMFFFHVNAWLLTSGNYTLKVVKL